MTKASIIIVDQHYIYCRLQFNDRLVLVLIVVLNLVLTVVLNFVSFRFVQKYSASTHVFVFVCMYYNLLCSATTYLAKKVVAEHSKKGHPKLFSESDRT
jgi:uncharacterized membrane protein YfhO